jgi:hypothetical protein
MTILAYIIVLVFGQFAFSISLMILMFVCGMIFYILPENIRVPLGMTVGGAAAGFTTIVFGYFVFKLSKFGVGPYVACLLSMTPPMITDYRKYQEAVLQRNTLDPLSPLPLTDLVSSMVNGARGQLIGTLLGVIVGGWWFL